MVVELKKKPIMFCHLEKCAGTFIGQTLKTREEKEKKHFMWVGHDIDDSIRTIMPNMFVVGNIRNPFSFYVSLWAFSGIHKKGHYDLFKTKYPQYLYLYSDSYNIANFRKWLRLMLLTEKDFLNEGFARYMKQHNVGLLTSRFFELYNNADFTYLSNVTANPLVNHFIRVEHLKEDLKKIDLPYTNRITNKSKHHHFSAYYGEEEKALVYKLDNYIFKKFNY